MRMDLGMRSTSHYDSMPCMTVASLEMSDEPKNPPPWKKVPTTWKKVPTAACFYGAPPPPKIEAT